MVKSELGKGRKGDRGSGRTMFRCGFLDWDCSWDPQLGGKQMAEAGLSGLSGIGCPLMHRGSILVKDGMKNTERIR
jgi:hypothetical protein